MSNGYLQDNPFGAGVKKNMNANTKKFEESADLSFDDACRAFGVQPPVYRTHSQPTAPAPRPVTPQFSAFDRDARAMDAWIRAAAINMPFFATKISGDSVTAILSGTDEKAVWAAQKRLLWEDCLPAAAKGTRPAMFTANDFMQQLTTRPFQRGGLFVAHATWTYLAPVVSAPSFDAATAYTAFLNAHGNEIADDLIAAARGEDPEHYLNGMTGDMLLYLLLGAKDAGGECYAEQEEYELLFDALDEQTRDAAQVRILKQPLYDYVAERREYPADQFGWTPELGFYRK